MSRARAARNLSETIERFEGAELGGRTDIMTQDTANSTADERAVYTRNVIESILSGTRGLWGC